MSINHDSQGSYDRFFPPAEEGDTGGQPATGGTPKAGPLRRFANGQDGQPRAEQAPEGPPHYGEDPRYGGDPRNEQPYSGPQPQYTPGPPAGPPAERYAAPQPPAERYAPPPPQSPAERSAMGERTDRYAPQPPAERYGSPPPPPPAERSYSGPPVTPVAPVAEPAQPPSPPMRQQLSPANPRQHFWTAPTGQPAERAWTEEVAAAQPAPKPNWTAPQPSFDPHRHQQPPAVPDWMNEPIDSRYVDQRVGDDEESLTFNADRLDLVGKRKLPPGRGWRKWLYWMTFRGVNLGLSPKEVAYAEMVESIRQPIRGDYKIGVVSLKGGVGKTTTTVTLGSVFAQLRKGDRVVALDGNPDFGNLVSRVPRQTNTTVKDLLADVDLSRYGDVRHHTSQNIHGLEVVAGERDLAQSERFSKTEYERVMAVLQRHYSLIFTDCGTGLINEAMAGVLDTANSLILVSSMTVDGARAASANIEWLLIHGHQHLVQRAVVILNTNKQGKSSANIDQLKEHFNPHVRAVHVIPFDDHLAEGGEVNLDLLDKKTKRSFEELAELIATDFPSATGKHTSEA